MIILEGRAAAIWCLGFTGESRFIAISREPARSASRFGYDGIEFWDLAGTKVKTVPANLPAYWFLLHPGGRWVYGEFGRKWRELTLLDLATGRKYGLQCAIRPCTFTMSPDGTRVLASAGMFSRSLKAADADCLICWRHRGVDRPRVEWERK